MKIILAIVLFAVLSSGCTSNHPEHKLDGRRDCSDSAHATIRENLSEQEFANALIGKWETVFAHPSGHNIQAADFRANGTATLVITKDKSKETKTGTYRVQFERKPDPHMITFGRIVIETTPGQLVLSRVNFGSHNGVLFPDANSSPFLRIDKEPYGVLKKTSQQPDAEVQSEGAPSD